MQEPLVSINMLTYNQEQFIVQAIEGVLMQKTNFAFELLIGEDCSTDCTREIINEYLQNYPKQIKVITSDNNVGATDNELRTLQACTGKYIAYCEGDDYWTDPYKLQKQVDFLEVNPDYGLVHGDINHLDQKTGKITKAVNKINNIKIQNGDIFEFLLCPGHPIKTMTVCLRKQLLENYYLNNLLIMGTEWKLIDISIWLIVSINSKIYYFDEVFATYRLSPETMSRSKDFIKIYKFHQKISQIRFFFLRNYLVDKKVRKIIFETYYNMLFYDGINLKNNRMIYRGRKGLNRLGLSLSTRQKIICLFNKIIKPC